MKTKNHLLPLLSVVVLMLTSACSSTKLIQNNLPPASVNIDGKPNEWASQLKQVGDQKVWLATANDQKFFYMCLVIEERPKITQIMRSGFITWFIPTENKEETFGIKYPLPEINQPKEKNPNKQREMDLQLDFDKQPAMQLDKQTDMQILGSDKTPLSLLPIENKDGIKAKLGNIEGKLVYELQVPLIVKEDYAFQISANPGDNLRLKFETGLIDLSEFRNDSKSDDVDRDSPRDLQMAAYRQRKVAMGTASSVAGLRFLEPLNYEMEITLVKQK